MEYRMLIVDDEKELTTALNNIFFGNGYQVIVENNGDAANQVVDKTPLDLVLLDIEMPGVSGIEVLKNIKAKQPNAKVIMVTGYTEYEEKAKKLGCDAFIKKPFAFAELEKTIAGLLQTKGYEELKEYSLGAKNMHAPKGSVLADILLVEPIEALAVPVMEFLKDSSKAGGYYQVYHVETTDRALCLQGGLLIHLVLIDLRTVTGIEVLVDALLENPSPPKDFIFYLESPIARYNDIVKKVNGKRWDGNPMDPASLKELGEIIGAAAKEHGLIKK